MLGPVRDVRMSISPTSLLAAFAHLNYLFPNFCFPNIDAQPNALLEVTGIYVPNTPCAETRSKSTGGKAGFRSFEATVRTKDSDKLYMVKALESSQFLLLPQLPQRLVLASKGVKGDTKLIILLC